jgi:peptidoglycan/LPS O-acetylase OafA/YrhL
VAGSGDRGGLEMSVSTSALRYYPTLDVLRLVAVTLTMLVHTPSVTERVAFLRPFSHGMWLGVDLFMLISGWLLGGQLLRDASRNRFNPPHFYVKRWLRTLPPYYAMLAVLYYFGPGPQFSRPLPWRVIVAHVTFLQIYIPPNLYGVSWSLCVEEHFYLALPALVWILLRWPRLSTIAGIVIVMGCVSIAGRISTYSREPGIYFQTHLRCDGLFIGLLFAWINLNRPAVWQRIGRYAVATGIVGVLMTLAIMASMSDDATRWKCIVVPTLGTWTLALVLFACVHEQSSWSRAGFRGLRYLGELTYSMYLVHDVIPRAWFGVSADPSGLRSMALHLTLVVALSMLLHHTIERPALLFRERLLRGPQQLPVPS